MSRRNIEKSLAENFSRTLCLEVAYYEYDAERVVKSNYSNISFTDCIVTSNHVEKLREFLVKNVEKYPCIFTHETKYHMNFSLSTDSEWRNKDCEVVSTKKVINKLTKLLEFKAELDFVYTASEAKNLLTRHASRKTLLRNEEKAIQSYWERVFSAVEALTEGLHKSTKVKVFENYLISINTFSPDSYEDCMSNIQYFTEQIEEIELEAILNPLVTDEMELTVTNLLP